MAWSGLTLNLTPGWTGPSAGGAESSSASSASSARTKAGESHGLSALAKGWFRRMALLSPSKARETAPEPSCYKRQRDEVRESLIRHRGDRPPGTRPAGDGQTRAFEEADFLWWA
ncbi:hypothetical protein Cob_v001835 [Colletotrichum orbiculare MAFF 240422]|uniref:Uncharacterized protein n=1 Tax=Colletotrichum orbiculare (strain 104-T / ATCC 96160 / CBS 514.97 / LARS 414 / MAFF 240422) TaxID=1213857 RepID=A0A484G6P3_COLOR|nr:hypothetical protein Cob_v001835 [Colletotrichum orbiculare MAFF 240422]